MTKATYDKAGNLLTRTDAKKRRTPLPMTNAIGQPAKALPVRPGCPL